MKPAVERSIMRIKAAIDRELDQLSDEGRKEVLREIDHQVRTRLEDIEEYGGKA